MYLLYAVFSEVHTSSVTNYHWIKLDANIYILFCIQFPWVVTFFIEYLKDYKSYNYSRWHCTADIFCVQHVGALVCCQLLKKLIKICENHLCLETAVMCTKKYVEYNIFWLIEVPKT
jgi:hypothetical protein